MSKRQIRAKEQANAEAFYAAQLAYISAEDGSAAELAAREKRDTLLAKFSPGDYATAMAIAIGFRNVLAKSREASFPTAAAA